MTNQGWLTLNDFSAKYRVSLSTLRRRVRANEVEYRFENGKYLLMDRPISKHARLQSNFRHEQASRPSSHQDETIEAAPFPEADLRMQELKRAYITVLHEKESQIMQFKEEIVDLKTLVKILESENERLKSYTKVLPLEP